MIPSRRKRFFKENGLVIRSWKSGEKDLYLKIFGEKSGLIDSVARGARHNPSRFGPFLGPGSLALFYFYQGPNRCHVTQCKGELSLLGVDLTIENSLLIQGFLGNFQKFLVGGKPYPRLFQMVSKMLHLAVIKECDTRLLLHAFHIKLLTFMGICPPLKSCGLCHKVFDNGETRAVEYNVTDGFLNCQNCESAESDKSYPIKIQSYTAIAQLQQKSLGECLMMDLDLETSSSIERFYRLFFRHHLEVELL